jgi:hypothetical protein
MTSPPMGLYHQDLIIGVHGPEIIAPNREDLLTRLLHRLQSFA